MSLRLSAGIGAVLSLALVSGCSSGPEVKTQAYAPLKNERTFESEFPIVWHGIESALKNAKIVDRDPEEVDAVELRQLSRRSLETDWIYTQSRDKYVEYKVNGTPRRKQLQMRVKYAIVAKRVIGGTDVSIRATEEIERLKEDGSADGYEEMEPDPSRAAELLDKINLAILSAAP